MFMCVTTFFLNALFFARVKFKVFHCYCLLFIGSNESEKKRKQLLQELEANLVHLQKVEVN